MKQALKLLTRHNLRITNINMSKILPEWHERQQKERLLGVSFTGFGDVVDMLNLDETTQRELFQEFRNHVHAVATEYAQEMQVPMPMLSTTQKPEGCWSMEYLRTLDEGLVFMDELAPDITSRTKGGQDGFAELSSSWHAEGQVVTKTFAATEVPLSNITLANGRVLRVTPWHPLSVNGQWKRAGELEVGDVIDARYGTYRNTRNAALQDFADMQQFRSDARNYATPTQMSPELAYLVGAYWANGSFTTHNRIKYHQRDLDVHSRIQQIWFDLFGVETTIIRSTDRDSFTQDLGSVKLTEWFRLNGLDKESSASLTRMPYAIRTSSAECIRAFIAGYADGDGCFFRGSFCIDSVAESFMRHLQEVGETVGLVFGLSINKARSNSFGQRPVFKLILSRMKSLPEALTQINRLSVKAQHNPLQAPLREFSYEPTKVIQVFTEAESTPTYDIEVCNTHAYYQGGLYSHNTLSTLAGVSSGLHAPYAPKYLRRVRVARMSAVADAMRRAGFQPEPEFGEADLETANTWVFTFPVNTPAKRKAHEYTAIEQLERYKLIQNNWTDHNSSITVYIAQDEVEEVIQWLRENWDSYVAVSFLPKNDQVYPLMPFEAVDELPEMQGNILDVEAWLDLITLQGGVITDDLESCATGACPVR